MQFLCGANRGVGSGGSGRTWVLLTIIVLALAATTPFQASAATASANLSLEAFFFTDVDRMSIQSSTDGCRPDATKLCTKTKIEDLAVADAMHSLDEDIEEIDLTQVENFFYTGDAFASAQFGRAEAWVEGFTTIFTISNSSNATSILNVGIHSLLELMEDPGFGEAEASGGFTLYAQSLSNENLFEAVFQQSADGPFMIWTDRFEVPAMGERKFQLSSEGVYAFAAEIPLPPSFPILVSGILSLLFLRRRWQDTPV